MEYASIYAEALKSGFDLYRNELLKQMSLPLPKDNEKEKDEWEKLNKFIFRPGADLPEGAYTYRDKNADEEA